MKFARLVEEINGSRVGRYKKIRSPSTPPQQTKVWKPIAFYPFAYPPPLPSRVSCTASGASGLHSATYTDNEQLVPCTPFGLILVGHVCGRPVRKSLEGGGKGESRRGTGTGNQSVLTRTDVRSADDPFAAAFSLRSRLCVLPINCLRLRPE